jgi:hypothetical protein
MPKTKVDTSFQEIVAHKMTFDLNLFSAFVKDSSIMCNMNYTLIAKEYRRVKCQRNTYIL